MSNIAENDRKQLNRFWREESNDCSPNKNHCHKVQHLYCYFKGDNTLAGKQTLNKHTCSTQSTVPYTDSFCCCISAKLSAIPLWYRAAFHINFYFKNGSKWCAFCENAIDAYVRFRVLCALEKTHAILFDLLRATQYVIIFGIFLHSWCILSPCQHPFSCTVVSI